MNTTGRAGRSNFGNSRGRSIVRGAIVLLALGAVSMSFGDAALAAGADWQSLFDGKTLDGWIQRNGKAKYTVEDGAIVGTTVLNTPNSFLCTEKMYTDFVLELEFLVEKGMNSGIQIRSHSFRYYNNYRVHGYQVEIDTSERAWSGGIYDEARRGWLYPWAVEPLPHRGHRPAHPHVGQRCAGGRPDGRPDRDRFHRPSGARLQDRRAADQVA